MDKNTILRANEFWWDGVAVLNYKEEDGTFRSINRQTLFDGANDLPCQLRYFQIGPGGYSTLERHEHTHLVMIVRGHGKVLLGYDILTVHEFDVFSIPSNTWHQFQAEGDSPFGFLCIVAADRDRPHLPTKEELSELRKYRPLASFIRSKHE